MADHIRRIMDKLEDCNNLEDYLNIRAQKCGFKDYEDLKKPMRKKIGKNLKTLREDHGCTQAEIGKLVHKTATAVASWEQGISNPDIVTLYFLSKLYGETIEHICVGWPPFR